MTSLAETQKRTALAFLDGYNEFTVEGLLRVRTEDCVHVSLPASMGRPDRNNEEYAMFFHQLERVLKNFKMTTLKILNDPDQHMAVAHAKGDGETPVGAYKNEYVFFFYFTEDGTKVRRVEEFVDTAFNAGLLPKLSEYMASKAAEAQR
ncbi:hypothetical protein BAUCODRAFT_160969 [Baudoinia panamericana UAMH 10762]|uniref:SnoaL-like domain-containing protein n=1 Tax=Baudoinia panamericana (strain UAMH 10762) TaxID=717646 RepID=M2MJJ3_BAUPA|nr:uncharacterized protein BAUCODRAFT_160969 [Baudoinia panamericana UAMH 10762]EMC91463.1 hypothetical protein BAUCODRAFT_160969 [Baudoinia panamericana UAMH 10762]